MTLSADNIYEIGSHQQGRGHYIKDPASVESYTLRWGKNLIHSDLLNVAQESIATSVWAAPAGITVGTDTKTGTTTTVNLSGGTAGQSYSVSNTITTSSGKTFKRSIFIRCKNL